MSRILFLRVCTRDGDHPSRATIAGRLKQLPSDLAGRLNIRQPLPKRQRLLPCSRWGLPGRLCHHRRRCALTAPFHPYPVTRAVYSLLHFPAGCPGLPLTTTVPCGVRTFLDPCLPTSVAVQDAAITRPTHSQPVTVLRAGRLAEVSDVIDAAHHAHLPIKLNDGDGGEV